MVASAYLAETSDLLADIFSMQNLCGDHLSHSVNCHHDKPERPIFARGSRSHRASNFSRDAPWYYQCLLANPETDNQETLEFTPQARVRHKQTLHFWQHPYHHADKSHVYSVIQQAFFGRAYILAGSVLVRDAGGQTWESSRLADTKSRLDYGAQTGGTTRQN